MRRFTMPACMNRWVGCGISVAVAILVGLAGCGKNGDEPAKKAPELQVEGKKDNNGKTIPAQTVALTKPPKLLPFKEAVILDPAPEGELQPPDTTYTGKN